MKCPSCEFVCSDLRDLCPQCTMDLRGHKKKLGIRVSNPELSYQELLQKNFKQPAKSQTKRSETSPSKGPSRGPLLAKPDLSSVWQGLSKASIKLRSLFEKRTAGAMPEAGAPQSTPEPEEEAALATPEFSSQEISSPELSSPKLSSPPESKTESNESLGAEVQPIAQENHEITAPPESRVEAAAPQPITTLVPTPTGPAVVDLSEAEDLSLEQLAEIIGEPEVPIQVTMVPPPNKESQPDVSIEFEIDEILAEPAPQTTPAETAEVSLKEILEHSYEQPPSDSEPTSAEIKTIDEDIPRVEQIQDAIPVPPVTVPTVEMIDFQTKEPERVQIGPALSEEELAAVSGAVEAIEAEEESDQDEDAEPLIEESPQKTEAEIFNQPAEEAISAQEEQPLEAAQSVSDNQTVASTDSTPINPSYLVDPELIIEFYEHTDRELKSSIFDSEIELSLEQFKTFQSAEDITLLYDIADDAILNPEIEKVFETQIETSVSKKVESKALAATLKKTERILSAPVFSLKATLKKGSPDSISEAIDTHHHHSGLPEGTELRLPTLQRWLTAFLIDLAVILLGALVLAFNIDLLTKEYSAMKIMSGTNLNPAELVMFSSTIFASFNLAMILYPLISVSVWGRSLGAQLCGIKLVTEHGKRPRFRHACLRALVYPLSVFNGGFLPIFWGARPLHDSLAKIVAYQSQPNEER